MDFSDF